MGEPLSQELLDRLRDLVGLINPDPADALHRRLVSTLQRMGGTAVGAQITALRFDFNWELRAAGAEFATAKTDYEHHLDKEVARLMLGDGHSGVKAKAIANGSDAAYMLLLKFRLAEQRERSMRKFLDTLDSALELHRTDRADQRAADLYHAREGV